MFNGKELDEETGLYYYGARYYNPKTALWLSVDPLSGYNPIFEKEHYINGQHNDGIYNPKNLNTYGYTYNNPTRFIDPNGKQNYFTHGTWPNNNTFKDQKNLNKAVNIAFKTNNEGNFEFEWNGHNSSEARMVAVNKLITHILTTMSRNPNVPITLVGQSHGGNVDIIALNIMSEMSIFKGRQLNLLTINTPVRNDYQLSNKTQSRVNHINIYDEGDPVQVRGGNSIIIPFTADETGRQTPVGSVYLTGEYGRAGRIFNKARNIKTARSNGIFNDFHNSHNRVYEWKYKLDKK